ncbi:four helix bundle protein [Candidatus Gottesmanbacteria bacterium]|nr:four helix bundle protein [Candidatus Gottesmanbacteria bacterium]
MINFHEHKLWQSAYVALMDLYEAIEKGDAPDLIISAETVAATIADALTRQDKKISNDLMQSAIGAVAMTRTHLAVAWGRGLLDDATFKKLDESYASLSSSLQ